MKMKAKIIGISESRLQKSKQHVPNISLPNYVYEHTSKGGTILCLDKNLKYKLTLSSPILENGQTHSNKLSAIC